jgi:sec-independent protein translocase protein TatC
MISNLDFKFNEDFELELELPFSEHVEELRQRSFQLFWIVLILTSIAFLDVKSLVKLLELPVTNVKFFQAAPGEYFLSTLKISFYTGILFSSPFALGQILLFLLPGLTQSEKKNYFTTFNYLFSFIW